MSVDDRLRPRFESRRRHQQRLQRAEALGADPRPAVRLLARRRLEVLDRAAGALEQLTRR